MEVTPTVEPLTSSITRFYNVLVSSLLQQQQPRKQKLMTIVIVIVIILRMILKILLTIVWNQMKCCLICRFIMIIRIRYYSQEEFLYFFINKFKLFLDLDPISKIFQTRTRSTQNFHTRSRPTEIFQTRARWVLGWGFKKFNPRRTLVRLGLRGWGWVFERGCESCD